jgi:hypothetical protein
MPYRSLVNDRAWWEQETDMHDAIKPFALVSPPHFHRALPTTLSTRRFVNQFALDDGSCFGVPGYDSDTTLPKHVV